MSENMTSAEELRINEMNYEKMMRAYAHEEERQIEGETVEARTERLAQVMIEKQKLTDWIATERNKIEYSEPEFKEKKASKKRSASKAEAVESVRPEKKYKKHEQTAIYISGLKKSMDSLVESDVTSVPYEDAMSANDIVTSVDELAYCPLLQDHISNDELVMMLDSMNAGIYEQNKTEQAEQIHKEGLDNLFISYEKLLAAIDKKYGKKLIKMTAKEYEKSKKEIDADLSLLLRAQENVDKYVDCYGGTEEKLKLQRRLRAYTIAYSKCCHGHDMDKEQEQQMIANDIAYYEANKLSMKDTRDFVMDKATVYHERRTKAVTAYINQTEKKAKVDEKERLDAAEEEEIRRVSAELASFYQHISAYVEDRREENTALTDDMNTIVSGYNNVWKKDIIPKEVLVKAANGMNLEKLKLLIPIFDKLRANGIRLDRSEDIQSVVPDVDEGCDDAEVVARWKERTAVRHAKAKSILNDEENALYSTWENMMMTVGEKLMIERAKQRRIEAYRDARIPSDLTIHMLIDDYNDSFDRLQATIYSTDEELLDGAYFEYLKEWDKCSVMFDLFRNNTYIAGLEKIARKPENADKQADNNNLYAKILAIRCLDGANYGVQILSKVTKNYMKKRFDEIAKYGKSYSRTPYAFVRPQAKV